MSKKRIFGLLIGLIFLILLIGKYSIVGTDIVVAVNKYSLPKLDYKVKYNDAVFCFELNKESLILNENCKNVDFKELKVCGLQNEVEGKWDDSFLKLNPIKVASSIAPDLKKFGCQNIIIDLEEAKVSQVVYQEWVKNFSLELQKNFKTSFAAYAKDQKMVNHPPANSQSYQFICDHFDEIWVMAYDYSIPPWTAEGELAPLEWVIKVVNYAKTKCEKNQIRVGLAAYGYDWKTRAIIYEKDYNQSLQKNLSVETTQKRLLKIKALKDLGINKYFIWARGMFDDSK